MNYETFVKAFKIDQVTLPEFVTNAYQYAEEHLSQKKLRETCINLHNGHMVKDTVIEDYILDILAKKAIKQQSDTIRVEVIE